MLTPEQRIVRNVLEAESRGNGYATVKRRKLQDGVALIDHLALQLSQVEADRDALRAAIAELGAELDAGLPHGATEVREVSD